jgi:hypothetical protein
VRSKRLWAFREQLAALPLSVQKQAQKAFEQFMTDPSYPGLNFEPVDPSDPRIYSVRIGLHYRALGVRKGDLIVWYWIGTHAEYDKLI